MLDSDTKRRIDACRDILVGKVPAPKSQVANREYEAWFMVAATSLNGVRSFQYHEKDALIDPEIPRNAKGWMRERMPAGYGEATDQPAFSARFDLDLAHQRSRSFRKLCSEWDKNAALA